MRKTSLVWLILKQCVARMCHDPFMEGLWEWKPLNLFFPKLWKGLISFPPLEGEKRPFMKEVKFLLAAYLNFLIAELIPVGSRNPLDWNEQHPSFLLPTVLSLKPVLSFMTPTFIRWNQCTIHSVITQQRQSKTLAKNIKIWKKIKAPGGKLSPTSDLLNLLWQWLSSLLAAPHRRQSNGLIRAAQTHAALDNPAPIFPPVARQTARPYRVASAAWHRWARKWLTAPRFLSVVSKKAAALTEEQRWDDEDEGEEMPGC